MAGTGIRFGFVGALALQTGCYAGLGGDDAVGDGGTTDGGDPAQGDSSGGGDDEADGGEPADPEAPDPQRVAISGARRLTAAEYTATVRTLLDLEVDASLLLPEDPRTPYDNDFTLQHASEALIAGAELLASDLATASLETDAGRGLVVGCEPTAPDDAECFAAFVDGFGPRVLRRPLTDEQRDALMALQAVGVEQDDFYAGVEAAVRGLLQHPQFLYRIERGTAVEGSDVLALDDWEVASRLSYLLWGDMPDAALFADAADGALTSEVGIVTATERMLDDPRTLRQVQRFHALWMDFEQLPHSAELSDALSRETAALIERVVFDEQRPWVELLLASETYLDETLAEHYDLPTPAGGEGWIEYPDDSRRQGLLSHGSFLSMGGAFDDTSPTQRGIAIRTRLFCEPDYSPPPEIDADNPPVSETSPCKWDRYVAHREDPGCAACHQQYDPIGFGLENYGPDGRYRTHDVGLPQCEIQSEGEVVGIGTFSGPLELANLLVADGRIEDCVAKQFYRFAHGRFELGNADAAAIDGLLAEEEPLVFDQMILDMVRAPEFRHRREETPED
ncbi:MAG: DUF1592 domain-containing protein [Myxococcota bacterium]